jgi:hypothetical protein
MASGRIAQSVLSWFEPTFEEQLKKTLLFLEELKQKLGQMKVP